MGDELERASEGEVQRDVDEILRGIQPPPEEVLELEFVYQALAHPRRRYVVYSLLSETRWTLTELATKLVSWEGDVPEDQVAPGHCDDAYVSLYHAHVPKLIDLDIVRYAGEDDEVIVAAGNAPQVLAVLEGAGASIDVAQETHARRNYDG